MSTTKNYKNFLLCGKTNLILQRACLLWYIYNVGFLYFPLKKKNVLEYWWPIVSVYCFTLQLDCISELSFLYPSIIIFWSTSLQVYLYLFTRQYFYVLKFYLILFVSCKVFIYLCCCYFNQRLVNTMIALNG